MDLFIKKQILHFVMAICITFSVVSSGNIVFDEHDCINNNCIDCLLINIFKNITNIDKISVYFSIYPKPQLQFIEPIMEVNIKSGFFLTEQKVRFNT